MNLIADGPVPLYGWPGLGGWDGSRGVRIAVTSRVGGVSTGRFEGLNLGFHVGDRYDDVLANRIRAAEAFGVELDEMVFCQQVHDRAVARVGVADKGRGSRSDGDAVPESDAAVTVDAGVALAVMIADCVPVVLHDPARRALAVVHAGWRGIVRGVVPAALAELAALGCSPKDVVAGIGPCVAADRYQVGDDVARAAREAFGSRAGDVLRPDADQGKYLFDLTAAVRLQLATCGVRHVSGTDLTTGPGTPFYSHRLEGPTGRFAMLAQLV